MTGPAIPETSSTNELKKADASVQFHVRDWTRCRVPCASPSTKRTSASIQVPFIQPDVMTPLKCAVLAFQSTAPSNSATKACASAPGPNLPVRPNVPDRVRGSLRRFDLPQRESQLSAVRPTQSSFPNGALLGVDARECRRERQLQRGSLRDWPGARAT